MGRKIKTQKELEELLEIMGKHFLELSKIFSYYAEFPEAALQDGLAKEITFHAIAATQAMTDYHQGVN